MTTHVKEIISKFGSREPKIGKAIRAEKIIRLWRKAVDKRILKQTEAEGIKSNTLYVLTSSSAWANELSLLRKKFLQKINSQAEGETIKDIRFRVGQLSGREKEEKSKNPKQGQKCKRCGAEHRREGAHCPVCYISIKNEKSLNLLRRLNADPNIDFKEIKKGMPDLDRFVFEKAKGRTKALSLDRLALIAREAIRGKSPRVLARLGEEAKAHLKVFGGEEDSVLKKALGTKTYQEFKEHKKKKKAKRGGRNG